MKFEYVFTVLTGGIPVGISCYSFENDEQAIGAVMMLAYRDIELFERSAVGQSKWVHRVSEGGDRSAPFTDESLVARVFIIAREGETGVALDRRSCAAK